LIGEGELIPFISIPVVSNSYTPGNLSSLTPYKLVTLAEGSADGFAVFGLFVGWAVGSVVGFFVGPSVGGFVAF